MSADAPDDDTIAPSTSSVAVTTSTTTTTSTSTSTTTTTLAPEPCEAASPISVGTATTGSIRELAETLETAGVAAAAGVIDALDSLRVPPPTLAGLVGRSSFKEPATVAVIEAIDALNAECGEVIVDLDVVPAGPTITPEGALVLTDYDGLSCEWGSAHEQTFVAVRCDRDDYESSYAVLDVATGSFAPLPSVLVQDDGEDVTWVVADDAIWWWSTAEIPASGLDPAAREHTLYRQPLGGGDREAMLTRMWSDSSYVEMVTATAYGTVSSEYDGEKDRIVFRDLQGAEVTAVGNEGNDDLFVVAPGIITIEGITFDMSAMAEVTPTINRFWDSDICTGALATVDNSGESPTATVMRRRGGALTVTKVPLDPNIYLDAVTPLADGLLYYDSNELVHVGPDGSRRWAIDYSIVEASAVFGDQLVILNGADELVGVDNTTGTEAPIESDRIAALESIFFTGDDPWIDHTTGRVIVETYDDDEGTVFRVADIAACATS